MRTRQEEIRIRKERREKIKSEKGEGKGNK
jgi:hypothetical protein